MAQILDPLPNSSNGSLLCCYVNATNQIQVARITNVVNWYFERVVFPGQRLIFEALPGALLEIHTGMMASAILSDTIPCERLSVDDDSTNATNNTNNISQKNDNNQTIESNVSKISDNISPFKTALVSAS